MKTLSGCSLACSAVHCCFVYVLVELRVSYSVSHHWVCTGDSPLPSIGSRWPRFPAFSGIIRALRLPASAWPSAYWFRQPAPRAPAGVRVRHEHSRHRAGPATGRGLDWSRWHPPFQRPCLRARAGSPRFPGDPSRDFATRARGVDWFGTRAGLCGSIEPQLGDPVPGQQLIELALRCPGDAVEHIGEPGLRGRALSPVSASAGRCCSDGCENGWGWARW